MSFLRVLLASVLVLVVVISALAEEDSRSRPNILFAIADDWSHGHSSVDGCRWIETPGFDRLAKSGLRFTNAFTPNAKCCPSRSILLTGRNSWQLEEAANHICYFPAKFKVYPEVLAERGYFVGHTGKGWGPGIAQTADGKSRLMTGKAFNKHKAKPEIRQVSNNEYAANFEDFLAAVPEQTPWCFWYGSTEPHRGYQQGVGVSRGKKLSDIEQVPGYWPDNETVRNDILDYAVEVEHFDAHLARMLTALEKSGQLENTLVVATSDHGMPFPRCKGQAYNYSNHVPLAIMWPKGIENPGRTVADYVSFADLAPTFLEVVGVDWSTSGMAESPGRSLTDIFRSGKSGQVNPARDHVLLGKERHDIGRPHDWGYPIRAIVENNWLYIKNFETSRWPGGNPETGYLNCDASPTKTLVLHSRTKPDQKKFWDLCFGKRPAEELYDLIADPDCLHNLAEAAAHRQKKESLAERMTAELRVQNDPRMFGKGQIFEEYIYANPGTRNFYERYLSGEKLDAGWVSPTDFEKAPLDE